LIAKSHPWQLSAIAVAAILGFWTNPAAALSLGRITVQSALGEPLKAEIDILDINADEATSLVTRVAAPEAFRAAGLEYNAAMGNLQTSLQTRPNGQRFIKLSSDRIINDPFVDMILETSWSSGRIVRDYTLLFDPPGLRSANLGTASSGQLPALTASPVRPIAPAATSASPPIESSMLAPAAPFKPVAETPTTVSQARKSEAQSLTVKAGDTAGHIAAAYKPANVSLDQMLVALLRANPDAFIKDNVNRIKAGAVLDLPSAEQAASTSAAQASQIIIAQSQDFNDFRRKFAANAPEATVAPASRDISGKVQATVQDKKPAAAASDKLTLSKGVVTAKNNEEQVANARNAAEAASRSTELAKNISDLGQLAAASGATAPASRASAAAKPALPAIVATPVAAPTPAAAPSSVATAAQPAVSVPAATASTAISAPVTAPPKKPIVAPPPEPLPEPGFIDTLLENPLLPVAAAALLALLGGFGLFKIRQRKKTASADNTNLTGPESFLGVSGGQSVDTSDHLANGSSMVYSPSQLDAVDEVDPVAEADVYLAYGRDLQAEEILKDALRHTPQRLAIHQKLLEIYAKRRDAKTFESIATLAFNLTDGTGPDWELICNKGLAIDPDNALYLPGGQPYEKPTALTGPAPFDAAPRMAAAPTAKQPAKEQLPSSSSFADLDLDLDLDFSSDEGEPGPTVSPEVAEPPPASATAGMLNLPDLNMDEVPESPVMPEPEPVTEPGALADLDFSLPSTESPTAEPELGLASPDAVTPPGQAASAAENDLMEFDLGSLSLDLGEEPITVAGSLPPEEQDPLETKLALAEEFRAIGDDDGARALIEEVIAEASGDMRAKAQRALSQL
jgi:pilus assembly protein FimV